MGICCTQDRVSEVPVNLVNRTVSFKGDMWHTFGYLDSTKFEGHIDQERYNDYQTLFNINLTGIETSDTKFFEKFEKGVAF